ncbi:MAG TPA: RsmE family RNA methyltransferase [Saprospiraceae bacterium]|nr:RsmE family RNA methyltransferase [Saprospiraceae bacterium]
MNLFLTEEIDRDEAYLTGEELNHCTRVMRYQTGDEIHLTDGKGHLFTGKIKSISGKKCSIQILDSKQGVKHPYHLHIGIAPTKNISRFEWFLEKAVEIGVDEVTPIICEHSERKHIQSERAIKIIRSAVKQSLKTHIPILHGRIKFMDFIDQPSDLIKIATHYDETNVQMRMLLGPKEKGYLVVIGPEGDFSEKELHAFKANNWQFANLGNYRLRTETAGIAVVQTVSSFHW